MLELMKLNKSFRLLAFTGLATVASFSGAIAQTLSSPAKQAILIEASTGDVLFEKGCMDIYAALYDGYDEIQKSIIHLNDKKEKKDFFEIIKRLIIMIKNVMTFQTN